MLFVDTNVLLYSISTRRADEAKARKAEAILATGGWGLSVQVLQEFYVNATRPSNPGALSHEEAADLLREFCKFPVQEMTVSVFQAALAAKQRFQVSFCDAAIIAAARELGCATLLSEDLNHGQDYGGVRVVNPFLV